MRAPSFEGMDEGEDRPSSWRRVKRLVPVQRGDAGVAGNLLGGKLEHVGVLGKGRADEAVGQLGALEAAVRLALEQAHLA